MYTQLPPPGVNTYKIDNNISSLVQEITSLPEGGYLLETPPDPEFYPRDDRGDGPPPTCPDITKYYETIKLGKKTIGGWTNRGNINRVSKVIVENNPDRKGILDFAGSGNYINNGGRDPPPKCAPSRKFEVYINDLEIAEGNALIISGMWAYSGFYLKNTEANKGLISKIGFDYGGGIWESSILSSSWYGYIKVSPSYGKVWTPPPIPEPSTYGAVLGAAGLGLYLLRKKRGQNRPRS